MTAERIVYYSLSGSEGGLPRSYQLQIGNSVASLREHNSRVPVVVFAYGGLPEELRRELSGYDVAVHEPGEYDEALRGHLPGAHRPLALYPTLHRWLSLPELVRTGARQILYLDCDTYFFHDVERLFDRYSECDWYAREEPFSHRSALGYDPAYLDESALLALARAEGASPVQPCNIGVVVMNNGLAGRIAARLPQLLTYVWRFMLWMHDRPIEDPGLTPELRSLIARSGLEAPGASALAYPAARPWIMDEVAIWLTLGAVPGLSQGFLRPDDVVQDGEFMMKPFSEDWIVCHYYSQTMLSFFSWVQRQNDDAPP